MHGRLATPLILVAVATTLASSTFAAGINLGWNDCGATAPEDLIVACNTNTGPPYELFGSFVPPAGIDQFVGLEARVSWIAADSLLPNWWQYGSTSCRGTNALTTDFDFTGGPFTCADPFSGAGQGGFVTMAGASPNAFGMRIFVALPEPIALDPSTEYYGFRIRLARSKTTGAGSCTGCDRTVCGILENIQLVQQTAGNDPILEQPLQRADAIWQSGFIAISDPFGQPGPGGLTCFDDRPTAARPHTWGAIKALYR